MTPRIQDAGRYVRTIRHLRSAQLAHRVRLRTQQATLRRVPRLFEPRWRHPGTESHWPWEFRALDAACPPRCGPAEELLEDRFTFLNQSYSLGDPPRWDPPGMSQLWLYHQHYWEWAWTLLAHPDQAAAKEAFARQFAGWNRSTRFGEWNAWAPYPTSIRTWVFVHVAPHLAAGTAAEDELLESIRLHAGFVRHNLELDVGGNHLVKNLKALIGAAVFFDDDAMLAHGLALLERQIRRQVMLDGGHFELSPSYHCQVLGDLIDLRNLLAAASRDLPTVLNDAVQRMRRWLGAMLMPDGDVPLFNDAERVGPDRIRALEPLLPDPSPLTVLRESGYVVMKPGPRVHLVADVGQPCPPELPAHAQADCLSYELAIDGERVIVDPGASEYGSGPQRHWERSTAAHNTVTVDGENQTEVWGSFRAGRRATAHLDAATADGETVTVSAHHDGYRHLPGAPVHHRTWVVTPQQIDVVDRIEGTGEHRLGLRLLMAEQATLGIDGSVKVPSCTIALNAPPTDGSTHLAEATHALGHGRLTEATALTWNATTSLPAELRTTIAACVDGNTPSAVPATSDVAADLPTKGTSG